MQLPAPRPTNTATWPTMTAGGDGQLQRRDVRRGRRHGDGHPERRPRASQYLVPLTATDHGGASAADYSGVPDQRDLRLRRIRKQSFTFSAAADEVNDDGRERRTGIRHPARGVTTGTTSCLHGVDHRRRRAGRDRSASYARDH